MGIFNPTKKLRIVFSTMFYPVAMGRYMADALRRRADVELFTVGPYSGNWIPWKGGIIVPEKYVYKPDFPLALMPGVAPSTVVYGDKALLDALPWTPDLWIEANAAMPARGRPAEKFAVIATDPHVIDYADRRREADFFFNMQTPYMQPGDIWLPYAYDPNWHRPTLVPPSQRVYDAALVGLQYQHRTELVNRLRSLGLKVYFDTGPSYDDAEAIYHQSRVGLNWSSLKDTTARVFEIMAYGIAPVLNRVPDLMQMFKEGEQFFGFDSIEEGTMAALKLAQDSFMADEIGRKAQAAVAPHTWDARMDSLLREVGLLK
jgi:hypothetical protein